MTAVAGVLSVALFAVAALVRPALAQQPSVPPAPRIGPHAAEVLVNDRWLYRRQQARLTPFVERRTWLFVDSLREQSDSLGSRTLYISLERRNSDQTTRIDTRGDGRWQSFAVSQRPRPSSPYVNAADSARMARFNLFQNQRLSLPGSLVWELVTPFHPARLRRGERWMDTLTRVADAHGARQALRGIRVSTLVGDTTVEGRQLWLVRDSMAMSFDERLLADERTLDTVVTIERTTRGVQKGRMLYDPALGLFRDRSDTTVLAGVAVLRYPDGRAFATSVRFERRRRWAVYDPSAYNTRQRALEAERERTMTEGVVFTPTNELDRRLASGDSTLRDSLFHVWQRALDPNERAGAYARLTLWARRDTALMRRLEDLRIADGDTAFMLDRLSDQLSWTGWRPSRAVDTAVMNRALTFMKDPGLVWEFGLGRDGLYENLAGALLTAPPAITSDTTRWPCTPAACKLIADQWSVAREPRLKKLGLLAHFVLDPKNWTDSVLADATSPALLGGARFLAHGVGATWPAASKTWIPASGADWRAWVEWMIGEDAEYARRRASLPTIPGLNRRSLRFERSHGNALRFTQARTGRNLLGELRAQLANATTDSARLVYEYLLFSLGEFRPTAASVASHIRSRSPILVELGTSELASLFGTDTPRADSATTFLLLDRLIGMTVGGEAPWRLLNPPADSSRRRSVLPPREVASERTLLLADSLPPALRTKWAARVPVITREEWNRRSERVGGTLFTLSSVLRIGPFTQLGVDSYGRVDRTPQQAPWLYYASTTYYLMEVDGEWLLVTVSSMIT